MKSGWATKFPYNFSWLGGDHPDPGRHADEQEVIYRVQAGRPMKPACAHGGASGVFYARLFVL